MDPGGYLLALACGSGLVRGMATTAICFIWKHRSNVMLIHIFRGPGRVFGFTEDVMGANLPSQFAPWNTFKSIELSRDGEPKAGVNSDECLDDIEKHGFHITDAHVRITESVV
jgi:hypothetical protein